MLAKVVISFLNISTVLIKEFKSGCWKNVFKKTVIIVNLEFKISVFKLN